MSAARNASRERCRILARKNYLANEIARLVSCGSTPPQETIVAWREASICCDMLMNRKNVSTSVKHGDGITK